MNIFLGIPIDGTNSKTVQQSFDAFRRKVFGEKPETDVKRKPEVKDDRKPSHNKSGEKNSAKNLDESKTDIKDLAEFVEAIKLDSASSSDEGKQSGNLLILEIFYIQ